MRCASVLPRQIRAAATASAQAAPLVFLGHGCLLTAGSARRLHRAQSFVPHVRRLAIVWPCQSHHIGTISAERVFRSRGLQQCGHQARFSLTAARAGHRRETHPPGHMRVSRRHAASAGIMPVLDTLQSVGIFAAKAYGVLLVAIFFLQRKLIFMPSGTLADPKAQGGDPVVITLPAGPEPRAERRAAAFFPPRLPKGPVLVFFHGNADQVGWGPAFLGIYFKDRYGLGLYGVEYPGYGLAQPGSPNEANIYAASEALLHYLQDVLGVEPEQIVLVGQSIGCAVAVEMARRGFGSRLVLLSPFTSLLDMSKALYPFLSPALRLLPFMLLDKFDNNAKVKSIGMPSLVVHGKEDEVVPFSMGQALSKQLPNAQFLPVPGVGHNDILDREDVLQEMAKFCLSSESGGKKV